MKSTNAKTHEIITNTDQQIRRLRSRVSRTSRNEGFKGLETHSVPGFFTSFSFRGISTQERDCFPAPREWQGGFATFSIKGEET